METYDYPILEKHGILVVYSILVNLPVKINFEDKVFHAITMYRKNSKGTDVICAIFPALIPGSYAVYVNNKFDHYVSVYPALSVETKLTLI